VESRAKKGIICGGETAGMVRGKLRKRFASLLGRKVVTDSAWVGKNRSLKKGRGGKREEKKKNQIRIQKK